MKQNRFDYTTPVTTITREQCERLIRLAIEEDAPAGDPTSEAIFSAERSATARIIAKEEGVLCGGPLILHFAEIFAEMTGYDLTVSAQKEDGSRFRPGDLLCTVTGSLRGILRAERIILNFLQYLSGISTTVANAVAIGGERIHLLDTRKTLPGYRKLAKYAVHCGGGNNHRIDLSDMAMIKDNHIAAAGGIAGAVQKIRDYRPALPIEVEIDRLDQLEEALDSRPDVILLDNMDGATVIEAVKRIRKTANPPRIEASGNLTPEKLKLLSEPGDLYASMGYLTHTTRFLDLSMEIEPDRI